MKIEFIQEMIDKLRHKPKGEWLQACFKAKGLFIKKDEIEDLYLGLSYGQFGINPKYLTRPSYNLCMPSVDFYSCYKVYSYFADIMPKLKNVYVAAAYYSAGFNLSKCSEKDRMNILELFCGVKNPNSVNNGLLKENLKGIFKKNIPESYVNGYETGIVLSLQMEAKERVTGHYRQYNKYGAEQLKWLLKIKKLAEINKQRAHIILFPFSNEYRMCLKTLYNTDLQTVNGTILDFCKENEINVIDFSNLELANSCFCDYDHLSEEGCKIFTKKLNDYIVNSVFLL